MRKSRKKTRLSNRNRDLNRISKRDKLISVEIDDYLDKMRERRRFKRERDYMREIEDKRTERFKIHDDRYMTDGRPAGVRVQKPRLTSLMKSRLAFNDPGRVIVCKRRKERRVVLFSLNRIGKGKGGSKRHRWVRDSHIKC